MVVVPRRRLAPFRTVGRFADPSGRLTGFAVTAGLALISLAASGIAVILGLVYNDGRLTPPLDDVYIHLQYARQLGRGAGFAYTDGMPPSTGASSLLYVLLLAVVWWLGVHGTAFLGVAIGLGMTAVATTVVLTYHLTTRLAGPRAGTWAGLLVAMSGPLIWGAASGMEVGLVAALATGSVLAFVVEQPRGRFVATPVVAAALALVRPEGLILAGALVAGMLGVTAHTLWTQRAVRARSIVTVAGCAVTIVAGATQLVIYGAMTGTANGVRAKSVLHQQTAQPLGEVADGTLRNLQHMLSALTALDAQDLVPPGTLALAVVGLVVLWSRSEHRRRTAVAVLAVGLGLVLLGIATLVTAQWQNQRYLQPFLPLLLLLAVIGVESAVRRPPIVHGVLTVALLFGVAYAPTWALRYAQEAATIREGPVSIATWLGERLPPGDTVAVNDVGATAYLSGHPVVDLVGLTTNGFARAANNGPGTLYEALRALPADRRPDWFSIYERWPGVPVDALRNASVLGAGPVATFELASPAHPKVGFAPPPCQSDLSCDRVNVWAAHWTHADSDAGDRPDVPVPGEIRDYVNVGSLRSEAEHQWSAQPPVPGSQPQSVVTTSTTATGAQVVDSGRHVVGGETYTLHRLVPGRPVVITARVAGREPLPRPSTGERSPVVSINGTTVGAWTLPTDQVAPWGEASITVPASLVTGPDLTVTTHPQRGELAPFPDRTTYGVWASQ